MSKEKKIGDMSPAEQAEAVQKAVTEFQEELTRTAPAIGRVLEEGEKPSGD